MNEHDLYRVMKDVDRKYTDELHQYAAELVTAKRRKGTMKQNTKKSSAVTRLFPWHIGISAAVVACAVIAVSIGKEVIGQEKQMQVGSRELQQAEKSTREQPIQPAAEITVPIESVMIETTVTEAAASEPVYTELELHNPEKRVISWEEQDALMEDGRAKYQEEGGFPIINTKPYIDKFMEPWSDKEAYDMHFAELNELEYKSYIYHMMLNSIDYFSSAEGRMTYGLNEGKTVIHFQTDDASGLSYESTNDADGTPVAEMYHSEAEHIDYRVDLRTNQYTAEHTAETWDFVVSDNDRCMILTDGTGLALNRNDPTWLEIGSNSCLFPQDYAMSRLSDFELWRITGVEDKLGIPCAVIEGQRGDRTFRMYTAVSTGFLMRYEEYYADGSLENLIETTSLTVDQDITVQQFDPDKYTLVEMQYPVDSADP